MAGSEVDVAGERYSISALTTFQQLHVSRKIAPLIPPLIPVYLSMGDMKVDENRLAEILEPLVNEVASLSDEHAEYVIGTCMSAVRRKQGDMWAPVWANGTTMFSDVGLDVTLRLVYHVVMDQLGPFIDGFLRKSHADKAEEPSA